MKFDAVLFDLDGTLLNTLGDLTDSVNYAMEQMNCPTHTQEEVKSYINNGTRHLIKCALPEGATDEQIEKCMAFFQNYYREHVAVKTCPYPGVMDILDEMLRRGIKTAVVSNKFDGAVKLLSRQYFGDRIMIAVGEHEAEGVRRKPHPDTVYEALKKLDVPLEKALYVGDSNVDIETARNAGIPCLSVSWGFRSRESLVEAGANYIIDEAGQFAAMMEKIENEN